jgi:hypothetical protein
MMTPANQPQDEASPDAETTAPLQQGGSGGSSALSGTGPSDKGGDPSLKVAEGLALAEAMKPIEAASADVYSADKQKSRDALNAAYDKAVAPDGELRLKFAKAHASFIRAAEDMAGRMEKWVDRLAVDGTTGRKLNERKTILENLRKLLGDHEKARADAQAETKRWADRHADWSSPVEKMKAILSEYADKIDKINADVNNDVNRDAQIFSFWFEVAPRHLQLTDEPLPTKAQEALDAVKTALKGFDKDIKNKLELGSARDDGSLYLIPAGGLDEKRRLVLLRWIEAAEAQSKAEAAYKLGPDDSATLRQSWDKLKGDAWIKDARSALETPAA